MCASSGFIRGGTRKRAARRERPPIPTKLPRTQGRSLQEKVQELDEEFVSDSWSGALSRSFHWIVPPGGDVVLAESEHDLADISGANCVGQISPCLS
jgi:hypothetical protein